MASPICVPAGKVAPHKLSPRVAQTLTGLLEGLGEKQVARRLGISKNTVHTYVKELYASFGVNSRCELLALWIAGDHLSVPTETKDLFSAVGSDSLPKLRGTRRWLSGMLAKLDQEIEARQDEATQRRLTNQGSFRCTASTAVST
jgi:DNA-binding CsgD family transcriptional regulator